jgi:DNA mismatch endonuclease (patch repair protein)
VADKLTKERRSKNIAAIRSKDMKPELVVRSLVHRMGYRFRLHRRDLVGSPDLVLPRHRMVIFVHGCFWHQHPRRACVDNHLPRSNTGYWVEKLARNVERDARNRRKLRRAGWKVVTIWECELRDAERVSLKLDRLLKT